MKNLKKYSILAVSAIFILSIFCACGSSTSEEDATKTTKATVTAGEAAEKEAQDRAGLRSEGKCLPGPLFVACTVIVAGHRLETLADAHNQITDKDIDLIGNGDGCACRIAAIGDSLNVQHGCGQTSQALPTDGG